MPGPTALTTVAASGTPYQLDTRQVAKASSALLNHIAAGGDEAPRTEKQNLLEDADADQDEKETDIPIWLNVTTKKHIIDKQRLKPGKVAIPHSLNTSTNTRICMISADPQRQYKNIVAHPSFPSHLSSKIGRVIGITKLKAKYKSYESRRQLAGEYDIFLADDRIITSLPQVLGKIFYKGTRRPIPISLTGDARKAKNAEGKRAQSQGEVKAGELVGEVKAVARDIEKALNAAVVHLSPSTTTAIKIGYASWTPERVRENIEAFVPAFIDKFVPQKWRNVRALHVKGPNTMALPIWLAEELWVDEDKDVVEKKMQPAPKPSKQERKLLQAAAKNASGEKQYIEEWDEVGPDGVIVPPKRANTKRKVREEAAELEKEIAERKAKAKERRQKALDDAGGVKL